MSSADPLEKSTLPYRAGAPARKRQVAADVVRAGVLLALLIGLGAGSGPLRSGPLTTASEEASLDGATWEGRRLLARMMWVKSEQVLHGGVEHEEAAGKEEHPHDDHHKEPHEEHHQKDGKHGHALAIPSKEEDFRGILGDLERAVKPYSDEQGMEIHRDQVQTLPFFRLMTQLDPHFIRGYTTGGAILCEAGKHAEAGLRFLQEGLRHNPDSFEIHTEVGRFHLVYFRDFAAAEHHLNQALTLAPRDRALSEEEFGAVTDAFRWLALCYVSSGKPERALQVATTGLAVVGPDVVLEKVLNRAGLRKGASEEKRAPATGARVSEESRKGSTRNRPATLIMK